MGGGASDDEPANPSPMGRSPRGRGSQRRFDQDARRDGSIPAWAGEPFGKPLELSSVRVDPRVGGGARRRGRVCALAAGRSPRGRGSLIALGQHRDRVRSIPAWAGEPCCSTRCIRRCRVDPRVGGGAHFMPANLGTPLGRSPRGRGSPARLRRQFGEIRSIPAWAGEPWFGTWWPSWPRVDPRVGGGADVVFAVGLVVCGRSPRGRGSRLAGAWPWRDLRSIPAWAGEPLGRGA